MTVTEWYTKKQSIAQTVFSGVQYSFLSSDDRQCFPFVYCKEFLIDAVAGEIHNKPVHMYGFEYVKDQNPPVCMDHCRLLIRNMSDYYFLRSVVNLKTFLHLIESKMGCETRSDIVVVENPPRAEGNIVLLTSPAKWMLAPPILSLYALMIRVGLVYNGEDGLWEFCQKIRDGKIKSSNVNDHSYLRAAWKTIMDVVESGGTCCFKPDMANNWPPYKDQWRIHESSGIVSLANGAAKHVNPDWYKS